MQEGSCSPKHLRACSQWPGSVGFSHCESPVLQSRPLQVAPPWGQQNRVSPVCSPRFWGPGAALAGRRPGALQLRGLAALLLPGNRARGGARLQLQGCPLPGRSHPRGDPPRHPQPRGCFPFQPRGSLFAVLPLGRSLFSADLFSSFCGGTLLAGSSSPSSIFKLEKGKCQPVLCLKGIINSGQLCLNLPVLPALQSRGFGSVTRRALHSLLILGSS